LRALPEEGPTEVGAEHKPASGRALYGGHYPKKGPHEVGAQHKSALGNAFYRGPDRA